MITIVVQEPGEPPEVRDIEPTLKNLQAIVGGLIQYVPGDAMGLPESIDVFCNEEGKNFDLEPNVHIGWDILCGTVYFVSNNGHGKTIGLTDVQISVVKQWLEDRR